MFYFDPLYILFTFPALILGMIASISIKSTYKKYSQIINGKNLTGIDVLSTVCNSENYKIAFIEGHEGLDNSFNPVNSTVKLSRDVARTPSIASVAITAHEIGHVSQHQENVLSIKLRSIIVPVVGFGTNIGYILIVIGIIIGLTQLSWLGIILFSSATLFSFLTLPIEIDASNRAISFIKKYRLLDDTEMVGARRVLNSAAFTYVAATLQSITTLFYFIFQIRNNKRN